MDEFGAIFRQQIYDFCLLNGAKLDGKSNISAQRRVSKTDGRRITVGPGRPPFARRIFLFPAMGSALALGFRYVAAHPSPAKRQRRGRRPGFQLASEMGMAPGRAALSASTRKQGHVFVLLDRDGSSERQENPEGRFNSCCGSMKADGELGGGWGGVKRLRAGLGMASRPALVFLDRAAGRT